MSLKRILQTCALTAGVLAWGGAQADYVAYSVFENETNPLPQNIDKIEPKYLINVKWGDYSGPKSRVGVLKVENRSSASSVSASFGSTQYHAEAGRQAVPVQGIEAMLMDAMHRSGRFRVMERKVLDEALKEQDLGASGRVAKPSAAKVGKVIGVQYLVQGVVTHYAPDYEGTKGGLGGAVSGLLGGIKLSSKKSMVGMNFRLIDATTGEVTFTKQVQTVMSESGFGLGALGWGGSGALGGFMDSYSKTPIGQAVIASVHKGIYELVKQIGTQRAQGSVIKVSGSNVFVNLGEGAVSKGEQLKAISKGEELVDPDTGVSLGSMEQEVGTLEVVQVKPKFSIARVLSMSGDLKRGDKIVSTRAAGQLEFASGWQGGGGSGGGSDDSSSDGGGGFGNF